MRTYIFKNMMEDTMSKRSNLLSFLLIMACTALMSGCGGGSSTAGTAAPPSGKLTQGPVKGATVFADRADSGTRFVQDADEISTTTDTNGNYALPSVPSYKYVLVSKGGTDTLTDQPAIQLLAQPGSANMTILTTLMTLAGDTPTATTLAEKLQALQPVKAPLDFDVSATATPAMLLLVKSVETAVQSLTAAVNANAVLSNFDIKPPQLAVIQFQALQQIAVGFATSTGLGTPAGLKNALTTALASSITEINKAPNIAIAPAAAATIADNAVTAAATVLGTSATSPSVLSVSAVQSEVALATANPAYKTVFANAFSGPMFSSIVLSATTTASTPVPYFPPNVVVMYINTIFGTITGSSGTSGGGTGVEFKQVQ
jgi:hypothetical protein